MFRHRQNPLQRVKGLILKLSAVCVLPSSESKSGNECIKSGSYSGKIDLTRDDQELWRFLRRKAQEVAVVWEEVILVAPCVSSSLAHGINYWIVTASEIFFLMESVSPSSLLYQQHVQYFPAAMIFISLTFL